MSSNNSKIEDQQDFYNERWEDFNFINSLKLLRCIAILDAIQRTRMRQPRIIDLGCGAGWLSNILAMFGPTLGVDLSTNAIEKAKVHYPSASFATVNIMRWENIDDHLNQYDIVISHEVIEHIDDQREYLTIAYSLLRQGGYLILTTPNRKIFEAFSPQKQKEWTNQPIEKWLSISDLRDLANNLFEITRITSIIPGYDPKGVLRLLNSHSLRQLLQNFKLIRSYESLMLYLGFGLHLLLVAHKSNRVNK